ncbi:MAG: helix-turn-helix domain-containing protein [Acidobacteriota bacterium]
MEEIEKREVLRAVVMCDGSILKAAKLLKMGKTSIYRKLMQWGYSVQHRLLTEHKSG